MLAAVTGHPSDTDLSRCIISVQCLLKVRRHFGRGATLSPTTRGHLSVSHGNARPEETPRARRSSAWRLLGSAVPVLGDSSGRPFQCLETPRVRRSSAWRLLGSGFPVLGDSSARRSSACRLLGPGVPVLGDSSGQAFQCLETPRTRRSSAWRLLGPGVPVLGDSSGQVFQCLETPRARRSSAWRFLGSAVPVLGDSSGQAFQCLETPRVSRPSAWRLLGPGVPVLGDATALVSLSAHGSCYHHHVVENKKYSTRTSLNGLGAAPPQRIELQHRHFVYLKFIFNIKNIGLR